MKSIVYEDPTTYDIPPSVDDVISIEDRPLTLDEVLDWLDLLEEVHANEADIRNSWVCTWS